MEEQIKAVINQEEQAEQGYREKKGGKRRRRKKDFRLTGCTAVKAAAFFLLIVSVVCGAAGAAVCYFAADCNWYVNNEETVVKYGLQGMAYRNAYIVRDCLQNDNEEWAVSYLKENNAEVAILNTEDVYSPDSSVFLWQSYAEAEAEETNGFYSGLYVDIGNVGTSYFSGERTTGRVEKQGEVPEYVFRVFFDPEFPIEDDIRQTYVFTVTMYELRYAAIGLLAGSVLLFFVCFVFLLCSAGHRNGREGIVPGVLTGIHFDVLTAATVFLISFLYEIVYRAVNSGGAAELFSLIFCLTGGILAMFWLMDFAIRLKLGKWWRHTLIYVVLKGLWRGLNFLAKGLWELLKGIPMVMTTVIIYLGICILEFFGCLLFMEAEGVVLWGIEKLVLLLVVLYLALTGKKLLKASGELAAGKEAYRVDTSRMVGAFKEQGENLNSLGQGISIAVAERMRSEHLKTELITNVSHDLKTPLTSIINYADLICQEETDNPKIKEYSEVLLRQSGRLKKLLEDLVEASKATTGNLEVNLTPCEVGVLLTQAVGEYQQKMEEKGLELRAVQPEAPVRILADGRHLWRVFENLLNNICKYAQENSRVYLSVEQREDKVYIIFRNMSKYALDISPEELEERFVRGDKSRHMEGNGLGLSIAKSLTELQNGKLSIVIDGDLFKVTLTFDALAE